MEELSDQQTIKTWLSRLSQTTRAPQLSTFSKFMEWLRADGGKFSEFTPDELVEYQKNANNGARYDMVDLAQNYVRQSKGRVNTKNARYFNLRSFFSHNRAELPRDPGFKVRSTQPPIQGTLTPDEIKKAILSCSPPYQAAYLVMFQAALDHQMFIYWNTHGYDDLVKQLRENPDTVKLSLPGRKRNRNVKPYYSFIGRDAIDALKNWFQQRPPNAEGIITNQFGKPLRNYDLKNYWLRHLRKIGIVELEKGARYTDKTGKGLHEMRDVYRSLWSKSPASHTVCEFCMGHTIDDLGYDKSFRDVEFYRSEYEKAAPYLNLMSRGEAFGLIEKNEVDKLRAEVRQLEREKEEQSHDALKMFETLEKRINDMEKRRG